MGDAGAPAEELAVERLIQAELDTHPLDRFRRDLGVCRQVLKVAAGREIDEKKRQQRSEGHDDERISQSREN